MRRCWNEGERPEFHADRADGRPRIFLAREEADWWRIRYQIAHEVLTGFACRASPTSIAHPGCGRRFSRS